MTMTLTPSDRAALVACVKDNPNPTERVYIGGKVSHYRWFRLVDQGYGKHMPPRLTWQAVALGKKLMEGK